jgi:outer membrane protein
MKTQCCLLAFSLFVICPAVSAAPMASTKNAATESTAVAVAPQGESILSLTEAIRIALKKNHRVLMAHEQVSQAESQIKESLAQALPQLKITSSYGRQDPVGQRISSGDNSAFASNPQFAALLGTSSVNTFNTRIGVNQTLFAGFKVVDGIKIAEKSLNLQKEALRQARQEVAYQVTEAYFTALKNWQVVALDKELIAQSEAHLKVVESKQRAGVTPAIDRLRAQNQRLSFLQSLSQDLRAYEKSLTALNQAMGRPAEQALQLNTSAQVEQLPELLRLQQSPQEAIKQALQQRSEVRQIQLNLDISQLTATVQSRGAWPTVSAGAAYSIQDTAVSDSNRNSNQNMNYSVNLDWPLFDGFKSQALTEKSLSEVERVRTQLDQQQQAVLVEVQNTIKDLNAIEERIRLSEESIALAQEQVRISQKTYQIGSGSNIDVLDAQIELQKSEQQAIFANFDQNLGYARLYQRLGLALNDEP